MWNEKPYRGIRISQDDVDLRTFGITRATRFVPYVWSLRGALVHKVQRIELRWWAMCNPRQLARLTSPHGTVYAVCGHTNYLSNKHTRMGQTPPLDALRCGRCQGEPGTFTKDGFGTKFRFTKQQARARLRP